MADGDTEITFPRLIEEIPSVEEHACGDQGSLEVPLSPSPRTRPRIQASTTASPEDARDDRSEQRPMKV